MKQILRNNFFNGLMLTGVLSIMSLGLQAQIMYQGFESEDDVIGWTFIDADGDTYNWQLTEGFGINGSNALTSASWVRISQTQGLALNPNNYAITPEIDLSTQSLNTFFTWNDITYDGNYPAEHYKVVIANGNTQEDVDNGEVVFEETLVATEDWTARSVDISQYRGKKIYVAFVHYDVSDQFLMGIDDVYVLGDLREVAMRSLDLDPYGLVQSTSTVSGSLQNLAVANIESLKLAYSVNGGPQVVQEWTGLNISPQGVFDYSFDEQVMFADESDHDVVVTVLEVNGEIDSNLDNNTLEDKIIVLSFRPDTRVVLEEGTGTWCGWCPRGAVMLDMLTERYSDAIGIAVHASVTGANEPMDIPAYTDDFLATGYPSMFANRVPENIMPGNIMNYSDLERVYIRNLAKLSPATLEMDVTYSDFGSGLVELDVNMSSQFAASLEGEFRYSVVITEDGVTGTGDGINPDTPGGTVDDYDQVNFYAGGAQGPLFGYENLPNPVPATDMVYNHVAISTSGYSGTVASAITAPVRNETYSHNEKILLTEDKIPNISVVVMLIDQATGEIINSGQAKSITSNLNDLKITQSNINVYPNPSSGNLTVSMELEQDENISLTLIDNLGSKLATKNYGTQRGLTELQFDATEAAAGIYYLQVRVGESATYRKVTIE